MLKNYLKIAWRNLTKHKVYSSINIFGLAVGIACCILIALYVHNEWSYDEFHTKSDRIYRAWVEETTGDGRRLLNTATPVPLPSTLSENIPEVEQATYLYNFNNLVRTGENADALNENVLVASPEFFQIFDFPLLQGDAGSVFNNPRSVVLTPEAARRYFGDRDPMQQTLLIRLGSSFESFTVTGIVDEPPSNSSLQFQMLIPDANLQELISERGRTSWFNIFGATFVTLQAGTDPAQLQPKLDRMMEGVLGDEIYSETEYAVGLQPLTDIHLNTDFPPALASVSDPAYSYVLAAIALLVLLIACVNFMTLSISKSTARAKEVGIRKTIGALRHHLMYQFWGEALLLTVLALAMGVLFAEMLMPFFNNLSGTMLELQATPASLGAMLIGVLLISLVAGIYPALILSGFRPMEVLKGRLKLSADRSLFRQSMVVFQFALSIALIIGTIVVHRQLAYVSQKDLGFQKNKIVVLDSGLSVGNDNTLTEVMESSMQRKALLQNRLGSMPEVEAVTASSFTPVQMAGWFRLGFRDDQNEQHAFHGNVVDTDFIPALGIEVTAGRNFSEQNTADKNRAIVVNQALVDYFGWEEPLGKRLPGPGFEDHEVIGVVENFNYESLHTPVDPLVLAMSPRLLFSGINNMSLNNSSSPRYSFRISSDDLAATMGQLKNIWAEIAAGVPFDYTFVDQALDSQYRQEQRLSRIVTAGSVLAIIIACLGLFGLASLMIVRRTKEIGVRKVLGASSSSIVMLVNKEFTKLIAIAFVLAAPVAWYLMSRWLQAFAYKVDVSIWIMLLAGMLTLLVAWLTISYQSIKATMINPADSLRSE